MASWKMKLLSMFFVLASLYTSAEANSQGDALYDLKIKLNASGSQLANWNRDQVNPCTWNSVSCDSNSNVVTVTLSSMGFTGVLSPRVGELQYLKVLSLPGNNISGGIPGTYGNLSSLTNLDLENNRLTGEIPFSLGKLTKLQILILSKNNLSGNIPDSFSQLSSLNDIRLAFNGLTGQIPDQLFQVVKYNFTDNKLNCGTNFSHSCTSDIPDQGGSHSSKIGTVLGSIAGVIGLSFVGFILLYFCKGRRKGYRPEVFVDVAGEDDRRIAFGQLKRFVWRELQVATDNFSDKMVLGQGGFGKVYKGVLGDGTKIAVKRSTDYESPGGEVAFLREVEMISVAVHKNLLRLIGFCTTPSERLLVYPFMQNLSVAYRLREFKPGEPVLDWSSRKRIALGTARGLEYLHEHCNPKIIHRDVKAANVLLDEDFEVVVGDFGLAKVVDVRRTSVTTQVRGTMGHIAPEYLSTGKSSERTDVFGYGIMLLELVTGQRAIDFSRLEDDDDVLLLDHLQIHKNSQSAFKRIPKQLQISREFPSSSNKDFPSSCKAPYFTKLTVGQQTAELPLSMLFYIVGHYLRQIMDISAWAISEQTGQTGHILLCTHFIFNDGCISEYFVMWIAYFVMWTHFFVESLFCNVGLCTQLFWNYDTMSWGHFV